VLPALSVVIPSHNRPDLLRACLTSVCRFAPPNTQIIVVDDGSAAEVVSVTAGEFAGVAVVRLPRRRGFCAAVNAGIAAAVHPVVELLNDDTEVCPGWAEAALARFRADAVAAVAPLVLRWPGGRDGQPAMIDSAGDRYYIGGVSAKRGRGEVLGPEYLEPRLVFGASASSAFYRRELLLRVGGFPESFGAYFEDADVAFRLHRAGGVIIYEPASRVLHYVSASHGPPRGDLLEQQACNEERVFWRNIPARDLPRALPRHLAVLAGKAWRRWREGTLSPFLRGKLRLLGEVAALRRHRQRLADLGRAESAESWQVETRYW
jgi:GT2 family glycosyltransferase